MAERLPDKSVIAVVIVFISLITSQSEVIVVSCIGQATMRLTIVSEESSEVVYVRFLMMIRWRYVYKRYKIATRTMADRSQKSEIMGYPKRQVNCANFGWTISGLSTHSHEMTSSVFVTHGKC